MYGLWYAARVFFPHPPLIAHVKERKMQNGLLMKTPGCVLVDLAVGGSNPGQCQSVCVHSLCCGSFQITETWCGSLFPPWLAAPPFPASWEDWGWDFSGRGVGVWWHKFSFTLALICSYQLPNYQPWAAAHSALFCGSLCVFCELYD